MLWVDADTVIVNPRVPVETFLPPWAFTDVNMLVTTDVDGLEGGVFALRVCTWSIRFLSAVLAFPHYRPEVPAAFRDQTAMAHMLADAAFADQVVRLPRRSLNACPTECDETAHPS